MNCIKYVDVNWHDAKCENNKYQISDDNYCFKNWYCKDNCDCPDTVILKYVFKEQVYYIRCLKNTYLNWIPVVASNGTPLINARSSSLISSDLTGSLEEANQLKEIPVIYPDYSAVDVGKGILWPKKAFAPYVDVTAWPPLKLAEISEKTKVPAYNLGFIVSQSPTVCKPTWGTYYSAEQGPLNDQIKKIREMGGDVSVSFGGGSNTPIHVTAPNVESLFKQYKLFTQGYKLTRIDFDIEGIWIDVAYKNDNIKNSKAIKMLQDFYKSEGENISVWFTLPILPTGLTVDGIRILQLALDEGVEISGVNAMTMDYGEGVVPDPKGKMGMYGIQAIKALKDQLNTLYKCSKSEAELWAMIGTTPMIGKNDVVSEIFMQSDANETLVFAKKNMIGLISMWSANRDYPSISGIPQKDNEFSEIFNEYNKLCCE
ncbi:chitinase [Romboutsia sp.]|uniref:chitinase n=1 Tax=Romboutsia sp. TaxID=1965302 RepID=UPI003F3AB519